MNTLCLEGFEIFNYGTCVNRITNLVRAHEYFSERGYFEIWWVLCHLHVSEVLFLQNVAPFGEVDVDRMRIRCVLCGEKINEHTQLHSVDQIIVFHDTIVS